MFRKISLWPLLLFSPFIAIGGVLAWYGFGELADARASLNWPAAAGEVVKSVVVEEETTVYSGTRNSGSSSRDEVMIYRAEIEYEFAVAGEMFEGVRVAYGDYGSDDPDHANEVVGRYPKGMAVDVYYKADDPEVCLLEPGIQRQAWSMPGIGVGMTMCAVLMAFLFGLKRGEQS